MILQVHDELNFSVPAKEKEIVEQVVIEEMEKAYRMHVPLKSRLRMGLQTGWRHIDNNH